MSFGQKLFPFVKNYTPSDYTGDSQNWSFIKTSEGIIFIGNSLGLIEFNGKNFRTIEIPGKICRKFCMDPETNTIYLGSSREFGKLVKDSLGQYQFQSLLYLVPEDDREFKDIWNVAAHEGSVYFQATDKIFKLSKDKIKILKPETVFHSMFSIDGKLFVFQKKKGLYELVNDQFKVQYGTEDLPTVDFLLKIRNKEYIIGSLPGGLYRYLPGVVNPLEELSKIIGPDLPYNTTRLTDSTIAIGTIRGGVFIVNINNWKITDRLNKENGLISNTVLSLSVIDNLLFVAQEGGFSLVDYFSAVRFIPAEQTGFDGGAQSVIRHNGIIYIATNQGVYFMDPTVSDSKFEIIEDIDYQCWEFLPFKDQLLVCSSTGLFMIKGKRAQKVNYHSSLYTISSDPNDPDVIFAGGKNGLYKFTYKNGKWSWKENVFNLKDEIRYLKFDKNGSLWLALKGRGLSRVDLPFKEDKDPEKIFTKEEKEYFSNAGIFSTSEEVFFSLEKDPNTFFTVSGAGDFDAKPGLILPSSAYSLTEGADKIYISTVTHPVLAKTNPLSIDSAAFRKFKSGIVTNIYYENNKNVWFAGDQIIYHFNPAQYNESSNKRDLKCLLRKILCNDDSLLFSGYTTSFELIELPYRYNNLNFDFIVPSFDPENKIDYQYILEGFNDWSAWNDETKTRFTNLDEGTYTFRVRGSDIFHNISEEAVFTFTILPPWYRTFWAYGGYFILLGLLVTGVSKWSNIQLRRAKVRLEKIVRERTYEIVAKNEELEIQKKVIEEKNKDITDSIRYAQRIQKAILPPEDSIKDLFKDSFIFFKPRDIVSGDFYWFHQLKDQSVLVAAVDCTGHGVPGAFMSIVGNNLLIRAVKEYQLQTPSEILDFLNAGVNETFRQQNIENSVRDGMDMSLIRISPNKIEFAGANNPLWIIRRGASEVEKIKADKQPIGIYQEESKPFRNQVLEISQGDQIFIFSDGYADQFGGPKGKKFKYQQLEDLLIANSNKSVEEQKQILSQTLEDWKGALEQVDDICIIGIKIP
jgi:serine phosphatase RsbU (regulator of sigma subunit)